MASHTKQKVFTKLDLRDTLGKRRRNGPRQPAEHFPPLNEAHIRILEFIHLMGGYSTTELVHMWCKLEGITKQTSKNYVKDKMLCEAMFHNHGVLEKHAEQFNVRNMYASNNQMNHGIMLVYSVSEKGEEVLKQAGKWNDHAPRMHGPYKHQMMTASLYQMFYLNARQAGVPITLQHELEPKTKKCAIYVHESGCVISDFEEAERNKIPKLIPDAVFVLHLDVPYLVFFELDRGTERGQESGRKTPIKNVRMYKHILQKKLYQGVLNVPDTYRPLMLEITTDALHHKRIMKAIETQHEGPCANIGIQTTRAFGPLPDDFFPPYYFNILGTFWERQGYPSIRFIKPTDSK